MEDVLSMIGSAETMHSYAHNNVTFHQPLIRWLGGQCSNFDQNPFAPKPDETLGSH